MAKKKAKKKVAKKTAGNNHPNFKKKGNQFTKKKVLDAIEKSGGFMTGVQKALGLRSWDSARIWVNKWPETKAAFAEHRQMLIDEAECVTKTCMKSSNDKVKLKASTYILDRLGRERGYGEHIEQAVTNNSELTEKEKKDARKQLAKDIAEELR